jgi:pimeloyl-ACP methyl ester carboxylesterase
VIEQVKQQGTKPLSESMPLRVFRYSALYKFLHKYSERMRPLIPEKVQQVKEWILHSSPQGVIDGNRAIATRADSLSTLSTITVPTLIICGGEDPLTGESVMNPIKEGIKGVKYVLVQDAGHLAPFDSVKEVSQAFLEFIAQMPQ